MDKNKTDVDTIDLTKVVKIQLLTQDNLLLAITHNSEFLMLSPAPVYHPVPDKVPTFSKDTVKRLTEIASEIFKVEVDGTEYCLKTVYRSGEESLIQELTALSTLPPHPNIIALKGVMVDDDGRVEGLLLPLILGQPLSRFTNLTCRQASRWKAEIEEAVLFLHNNKTVWGDAKAGNVMVDSKTGSICLMDFGGGATAGWVDHELYGTFEGDLEGVRRIQEFIDKLVGSN